MPTRIHRQRSSIHDHQPLWASRLPSIATACLLAILLPACVTPERKPADESTPPAAHPTAPAPPTPVPTPPPPDPSARPIATPPTPTPKPAPPRVKPTPRPQPSPTPAPTATPRRSQTDIVALRLAQSFRVLRSGGSTIIVRPKAPPTRSNASPSLYEKAIILGKIRGVLNTAVPNTPDARANYHQGAATLEFPASISPGAASNAVERTLGIEGVDEVTASFSSTPRDR